MTSSQDSSNILLRPCLVGVGDRTWRASVKAVPCRSREIGLGGQGTGDEDFGETIGNALRDSSSVLDLRTELSET